MRTALSLFAAALAVGAGSAATTPAPPRLTAVRFVDVRHGWAAGPGAILATGDGGHSWRRQYTGGAAFRSLDFVDTRNGWAVAGRKLLRTTDAGQTWVAGGEPSRPLEQVDFVTPSLGWGTGGGLLSRSADGGRTWQPVRTGITSVCFAEAGSGWAGAAGRVLRSQDGGRTWQTVLRAPRWLAPQANGSVGCAGARVAYAYFVGGAAAGNIGQVVYRTIDAGRTWKPVLAEGMLLHYFPGLKAETENYPGPFQVLDARHAVFLGFCPQCIGGPLPIAVLAVTADAGLHWSRRRVPGRCAPISGDVSFADSRHGWIATTRPSYALSGCRRPAAGLILATADGGRTWRRIL